MKTYTKQQAEEQYQKLPQVLREAIFSAEVAEKMYDIGHRNGLNIEKTGFLAEESGYVVLGLTHPREFVGQLTERLEVTTDKAKEIAGQVNHEIFFPLHEALKQAHGVDVKEEVIEKAEPLLHAQTRTVPPAAGTRTPLEQAQAGQAAQTDAHEQREQIKPQGETIDLRQQYKPKMPEGTPPSKIPPINLRAQREGVPQGGIIPKQGISFPPKKHEPQRSPAESGTLRGEQARTAPPAAGAQTDTDSGKREQPGQERTPLEQAQTWQAARTDGAGENVKTSPFGISSGRLVEDFEKKTQPAPPRPSSDSFAKATESEKDTGDAAKPPPTPAQETPAARTAPQSNTHEKEETPKPSEPARSPISSPTPSLKATEGTAPPNIPLKEEVLPPPARKQDPYREHIE